ncbi:MAG: DUF4387 domain-containing protein [Planctomycetota bacterium]|jgi:hypothetical protein
MKKCLREVAKVIRSKNAGPFELTFDILFSDKSIFRTVRERGSFTKEGMAKLYGLTVDDIYDIIYFEPANAVKITVRRPVASGDPGETDVYGAQQHGPLMEMCLEL